MRVHIGVCVCVLLKINLRVWQVVFVWMIQAPLCLQLYFLIVYLLDFIKFLFYLYYFHTFFMYFLLFVKGRQVNFPFKD